MRLTAKKSVLLDFMTESLMSKVKASSGTAHITSTPEGISFANNFIQDLIVVGQYLPAHFTSYDVNSTEEFTITSTLFDALKAFTDDDIHLETLQGNIVLRSLTDSYVEAESASHKNNFKVPETEFGLAPSNIPFKTVLELYTAPFKSMPDAQNYEIDVIDGKLFVTTKINNIAPFRREITPISTPKLANCSTALDNKGFKYIFCCNAQKLYAHLYEDAVCTSMFDDTHKLSYISSAVKVM